MPSKDKDRDTKVRQAYHEATNRLRREYRDRFKALQAEVAAELGIDYKPRPTKEERAEADLKKLLDENPGLRSSLVDELRQQMAEQPVEGKPAVAEVPQSDTA